MAEVTSEEYTFLPARRLLVEGVEFFLFLVYDCLWTRIACAFAAMLVDVDSCERVAAS